MKYANFERGLVEWIWNSRDGVTPFVIFHPVEGVEMRHVDWHEDAYIPNYVPVISSRVFLDMTREAATTYAKRRVNKFWNQGMGQGFESKEEAIKVISDDLFHEGKAPNLVPVSRALRQHFLDRARQSPIRPEGWTIEKEIKMRSSYK